MADAGPAVPPFTTLTQRTSSISATTFSTAQPTRNQSAAHDHWNKAYIIPWILVFAALSSGMIVACFYLWKAWKIRQREKHSRAAKLAVTSEKEHIERITPSPTGGRDEESKIGFETIVKGG